MSEITRLVVRIMILSGLNLIAMNEMESWGQTAPHILPPRIEPNQTESSNPTQQKQREEIGAKDESEVKPETGTGPAAATASETKKGESEEVSTDKNPERMKEHDTETPSEAIELRQQYLLKELNEISLQIDRLNLKPDPSSIPPLRDSPSLNMGLSAELFQLIDNRQNSSPTLNTWRLSPLIQYRVNHKIFFHSRINFENTGSEAHAPGSRQKGQSRVEFAYLDLLHSTTFNVRIGQQLLPIGLVNLYPSGLSYYGVSPPELETQLIPYPWSENGVVILGKQSQLSYQLGAVNSLVGENFTANNFIRDGRQNGLMAKVQNVAGIGRLDYLFPTGLLGTSIFVGQTGQDQNSINEGTLSLYEAHLKISWSHYRLKALMAEGRIEKADSISIAAPGNPQIPEKARGYYVCLSADILGLFSSGGEKLSLPVFVEYSQYDLNDRVPKGKLRNAQLAKSLTKIGLNYLPEKNLAFKIDYQFRKNQASNEDDIFSLGISLLL
ncbi:MAG: hypothetical protein KDD35_02865 [Bdellovibrionales bacterium]|nr:hypothetical protein [Bdellovibrionales bacterium]